MSGNVVAMTSPAGRNGGGVVRSVVADDHRDVDLADLRGTLEGEDAGPCLSPSASTLTIWLEVSSPKRIFPRGCLDLALDRATQRPRAQASLAISRSTIWTISSCESCGKTIVVDPVEELRPEVLLELVGHLGLHPVVWSERVSGPAEKPMAALEMSRVPRLVVMMMTVFLKSTIRPGSR